MKQFEGDRSIVPQILGEIDRPHTAPPELALERIRHRERRLQLHPEIFHRAQSIEVGIMYVRVCGTTSMGRS